MQEVVVFGEQLEQEFYSNFFQRCNSQLQNFDELSDLFGTLSFPEDKALRQNPILVRLSRLETSDDSITREKLQNLEQSVQKARTELSQNEYEDLKTELTSPERETAFASLLELSVLQHFLNQGYSPQPEPDLSNGGKADLKIPDSSEVYFEITNISQDKVESDIEEMLDMSGQELLERLDENEYASLYLDTFAFEWNQDGDQSLKKTQTKEKIVEQFDEGKLKELAKISEKNRIKLPDMKNSNIADENISEFPGDLRVWDDYGVNLGKTLEENSGEPVVQAVRDKTFGEITGAIESVSIREGRKKVRMNVMGSYPHGTGEHRERRFLNQIEHKLEEKISQKSQREPGQPNILIIKGSFWAYRGFTEGKSQLATEGRSKVIQEVKDFLKEEKPSDLNAVILMEKNPENRIYINNPYSDDMLDEKLQETEVYEELRG